MLLEQKKVFLCLSLQDLKDTEIVAPSNTRITINIVKYVMS